MNVREAAKNSKKASTDVKANTETHVSQLNISDAKFMNREPVLPILPVFILLSFVSTYIQYFHFNRFIP